jgi:hypothetical protein
LADFISGWLWRILSVACFSGFYQRLALAVFMNGWLWRILLVAGFGGFYQWPSHKEWKRCTGQVGLALSLFRG